MMLGARTGAWAKSGSGVPTARDYVQDGLVAMWDGIENAGWGVHDQNATVWKDLVGERNLTIRPNVGFVEDDCLFCNGESNGAYLIGVQTIGGDGLTAEVVLSLPYGHKDACIANISTEYVDYFKGFWGSRGSSSISYKGKPTGTEISLSDYVNGDIMSISHSTAPLTIKNGMKSTYIAYMGWGERDGISIGSRENSATSAMACRIYALRLYNKNLIIDEMMSNYAVDKARFNLP